MRLAIPVVGISVAVALIASQVIPAKSAQPDLGRSFSFEETDVVADAGIALREQHREGEKKAFARSFVFDPVVVAGRTHKQTIAARAH